MEVERDERETQTTDTAIGFVSIASKWLQVPVGASFFPTTVSYSPSHFFTHHSVGAYVMLGQGSPALADVVPGLVRPYRDEQFIPTIVADEQVRARTHSQIQKHAHNTCKHCSTRMHFGKSCVLFLFQPLACFLELSLQPQALLNWPDWYRFFLYRALPWASPTRHAAHSARR